MLSRVKNELLRSPITTVGTLLAALFTGAILLQDFSLVSVKSLNSNITYRPDIQIFGLAIGSSVLAATVSRLTSYISAIAGFFLSIFAASLVLFLTCLSAEPTIRETSYAMQGGVETPLIDMIFWTVVGVNLIINAEWTLKRLRAFVTKNSDENDGNHWLLVPIILVVWLGLFAGASTKISEYLLPDHYKKYRIEMQQVDVGYESQPLENDEK